MLKTDGVSVRSSRGAHAETQLADIREMVEALLKSRENVKEILVVLENENSEARADFVLQDKTSRNAPPIPETIQRGLPLVYQLTAEEVVMKNLAASKQW